MRLISSSRAAAVAKWLEALTLITPSLTAESVEARTTIQLHVKKPCLLVPDAAVQMARWFP